MEPVRIFQQNGKIHLFFDTLLSVAQARALHAQLGQVLAQPNSLVLDGLVLDAGQVEQVDTAAMQVLAGFCRQLQELGVPMRWHAVSPAMQQAGHLLGLEHLVEVAA